MCVWLGCLYQFVEQLTNFRQLCTLQIGTYVLLEMEPQWQKMLLKDQDTWSVKVQITVALKR